MSAGPSVPEDLPERERGVVLLVDDESVVLDVGAKMLECLGYEVIRAAGGRDALAIFERDHDRIDVVILDLIMPDLGGPGVFDAIRAIAPDVRVLLSSGYCREDGAADLLQRGCDGFIQKPFGLDRLAESIRALGVA